MRNILILIVLFLTTEAQAVCTSPISRLNINPGQIPTSSKYNQDFDALYEKANELSGDCLADGTVRAKQIEDAALDTDKFADGSVTAAKLADGVVPSYGTPLRIRAYTSAGAHTWSKSTDVGSIFIQVVGGGGGSGAYNRAATAGGGSSFGAHCVANGGGGASSTGVTGAAGGTGGTASNGHINLTGGSGGKSNPLLNPGGRSFLGTLGAGAHQMQYQGGGGGGAGGYCAKLISAESLADSVSITVGAGGTYTVAGLAGSAGAVIIYEFGE